MNARIGYSCSEVAEMLYGKTPDGRVDPRNVKRVSDAVRNDSIPCVRKPDGKRLTPYVIKAQWVQEAGLLNTDTGPTAA